MRAGPFTGFSSAPGATKEAVKYVLQASDASPQDQHLSLWIRTRAIASYIDGTNANANANAAR